ncbi:hypothetical protein EKO27_g7521, partial [Xylaria grammica]
MAAATAAQATPITMTSTGGGEAGGSRKGGAVEDERLPMPSRNPLPLSASQEAQVREVFNARPPKPAFADCARNHTFSVSFACRALSRAMNNCMLAHATPEEQDR